MPTPAKARQPRHLVPLKVQVPVKWAERLRELADEQAISVADLVRIFLRAGLYGEKP